MLRKIIAVARSKWPVVSKEVCLCLLSAFLLILSYPRFNFEILAWIAFVPLFFALRGKSKPVAFLLAFFTGVIFWSGNVYWLAHVTLLGTIVLVLYLALYFGFFGLLIRNYELRATSYELIFIPSLWVLLEYVRSYLFSGFPWSLLGYTQYLNLPIIQISDLTGAWGISFLVMLVNMAVFVAVSRQPPAASKTRAFIVSLLIIIFVLCYGYFKISHFQHTTDELRIKISVIQGDIPQEEKWVPENRYKVLRKYLLISSQAASGFPDLIIWPEAALPVVLEEEPEIFAQVKDSVGQLKIPLLLGAVTEREALYYNSAILVSDKTKNVVRYDKIHLVPFGEYIPLKKYLSFLQTIAPIGDIERGKEYTIFQIPISKSQIPNKSQFPNPKLEKPVNFAVLICFEDLFPELSRRFVMKGATFLVNITNDAWYKQTSAPYQHLSASVFRAVENRVYLARAANTGISGFIAPSGKIISLVSDQAGRNIFVDGFSTQNISLIRKMSFYTRQGDIFVLLCFLFVLYGACMALKVLHFKF